ncbi:Roadblock/LC7 domain containing protein [Novymonas esmeraldas]|uniref:Roadblock/LC7 domain containing protein n=1 Tax=Novymonas esmeraldas TaxID=1808958 RepID=A0AAW0EXD0_9TRYP
MSLEAVEGVMEHITYTKGVVGVVVCTAEGEPIRDSFQSLDRSVAQSYATIAADLARQAALLFAPAKVRGGGGDAAAKPVVKKKSVSAPLPPIQESTVELIRVRTLQHEIVIRCSADYLIAIVQEPVG